MKVRDDGVCLCGLPSGLWMLDTVVLEQKEFGSDGPGSIRLKSSRLELNGLLGLVPVTPVPVLEDRFCLVV